MNTNANTRDGSAWPIPVLLYHSVAEQPAERIADFAVSPEVFARQLEVVQRSGRTVVSFSELTDRMAAGFESDPRLTCITFDDGWHDNLAAAAQLAAAGMPATIYVTAGFLGEADMLSNEELKQLSEAPGIEIGAHSVSHPRLDELSGEELRAEVVDSKWALEQLVETPVRSFAYPHGAYHGASRAAVQDAGFESAAAVKNALSHAADDRFAIARWTVTPNDTDEQIAALMNGEGAPLAWRGERLRTRGYRTVRRLRRRLRGAQ